MSLGQFYQRRIDCDKCGWGQMLVFNSEDVTIPDCWHETEEDGVKKHLCDSCYKASQPKSYRYRGFKTELTLNKYDALDDDLYCDEIKSELLKLLYKTHDITVNVNAGRNDDVIVSLKLTPKESWWKDQEIH